MGKEEKKELTKKTMKLLLPVVQKKSKGQENVNLPNFWKKIDLSTTKIDLEPPPKPVQNRCSKPLSEVVIEFLTPF